MKPKSARPDLTDEDKIAVIWPSKTRLLAIIH